LRESDHNDDYNGKTGRDQAGGGQTAEAGIIHR
jgi:hypothetical protein